MARKKIDDQLVAQWVHQRRKGASYRSIGREFGIDPRTVKSWIEKAGTQGGKEHWEAVSRQVDATYLEGHYRMLVQIAAAVLSAVRTDPVRAHPELTARRLIGNQILSGVQKFSRLLADRGVPEEGTFPEGIRGPEAERLGLKLFHALMEHEPLLKKAIEVWEAEWNRFQKERGGLIEAARNLLKYEHVEEDAAKISVMIVDEALRQNLRGEEPMSSREDGLEDKTFRLSRCSPGREMKVCIGSKEKVEAMRKAYEKVFSQISHEERIAPVKEILSSLEHHAQEIEDFVDRLILVGRPQGTCSLCPN